MIESSSFADFSLRGFTVGEWQADRADGTLTGGGTQQRLEPKVMDLLVLLAGQGGRVVSRDAIMTALWPGLVVGDDSLARTVSKLRQALGDDARAPTYIETIAKRGYRLLAAVGPLPAHARAFGQDSVAQRSSRFAVWTAVALALAAALGIGGYGLFGHAAHPPQDESRQLLTRADDYYFQFSRGDNEAAIELYQRVLGLHPDDALAMAGLANALTQRCIRWPQTMDDAPHEFTRLGDALASGYLGKEPVRSQLQRAQHLAERAVAVAPDVAAAQKALGFVASAQGRFDTALDAYQRAVALDPDAWAPLINIGDVLEISGKADQALPYFERAYTVMGRVYDRNPVQIRPWHANLGVLIAGRYQARGDMPSAEIWYRRVLSQSPFHREATMGLAAVLRAGGDDAEASRLCAELKLRLGDEHACEPKAREKRPG
jgi:DNA-binding winged helix-turn-helix (wHTH) protein/Flp pilus assembly protein TadD